MHSRENVMRLGVFRGQGGTDDVNKEVRAPFLSGFQITLAHLTTFGGWGGWGLQSKEKNCVLFVPVFVSEDFNRSVMRRREFFLMPLVFYIIPPFFLVPGCGFSDNCGLFFVDIVI